MGTVCKRTYGGRRVDDHCACLSCCRRISFKPPSVQLLTLQATYKIRLICRRMYPRYVRYMAKDTEFGQDQQIRRAPARAERGREASCAAGRPLSGSSIGTACLFARRLAATAVLNLDQSGAARTLVELSQPPARGGLTKPSLTHSGYRGSDANRGRRPSKRLAACASRRAAPLAGL